MTEDIGTARWFGTSWGAPCCIPGAQVETPTGACERCLVPFKPGDRGMGCPDGMTGLYAWWHLPCWLETVVGPELRDEAMKGITPG